MHLNHLSSPHPWPLSHGKTVFHKTGPCCQKGWGPLLYTIMYWHKVASTLLRRKIMKDLTWLSLSLKELENQAFLRFFFFRGGHPTNEKH